MSIVALAPLLFALQPAMAGEFIVDWGPEVELRSSGTWARAIWTDDGWKLFHGSNGDYYVADLTKTGDTFADWEMDRNGRTQLTTHGELKDHSIKRCPDGTYLHIASANVAEPNDSAYAWVYDADFSVIASAPLAERVQRAHNDAAHFCSQLGAGVAYGGGQGPGEIFTIGSDLSMTSAVQTEWSARLTGASFWVDPDAGEITLVTAADPSELSKFTYDTDWNLVSQDSTPFAEPGTRAYWPMGLLKVGDYWMVAHVIRPEQTNVGGDDGNVRIVVLDESWSLVEDATLTANEIEDSGQRVWLARNGSQVLLSYDRQREHTIIELSIDLDRFNVDADADTGWDGSSDWGSGGGAGSGSDGDGVTDDTAGDEDDDAGSEGCDGCASTGTAPLGLAGSLALFAVAARRREP